jgi:two-component sensor histidine kinase
MNTLSKILDLDRAKYGDPKKDRIYWLSGIFFSIAGLIPIVESISLIGSEHQVFGQMQFLFGVFLLSMIWARRVFPVRPLIHIAFLIAETQFYYYNVYYGLESGNYIFYIAIQMAIAFFFYGNYMKDFYFQIGLSFICLYLSIYGPFVIDQVVITEYEMKSLFVYNIFSGIITVFIFALFFIRQLSQKQNEIEAKIKEKEILLSEVNHRVRNNLNVISSLLKLQRESVKSIEAKEAISQSALRVHSMAWVHNQLYKNTESKSINFKEYIEQLVSEIRYSTGIDQEISLDLKVDPINIDVSKAIPLGQIINELITNSIKHAFSKIMNPEISVRINQLEKGIELIYKDNGCGYDRSKVSKDSLGIFLITSLCDQIDGECAFDTEGSFEYHLRVKDVSVQ